MSTDTAARVRCAYLHMQVCIRVPQERLPGQFCIYLLKVRVAVCLRSFPEIDVYNMKYSSHVVLIMLRD